MACPNVVSHTQIWQLSRVAQIWRVQCFDFLSPALITINYYCPTAVKTVSALIDSDAGVTSGRGMVEFDGLPNFNGLPAVTVNAGELSVDFESKYVSRIKVLCIKCTVLCIKCTVSQGIKTRYTVLVFFLCIIQRKKNKIDLFCYLKT